MVRRASAAARCSYRSVKPLHQKCSILKRSKRAWSLPPAAFLRSSSPGSIHHGFFRSLVLPDCATPATVEAPLDIPIPFLFRRPSASAYDELWLRTLRDPGRPCRRDDPKPLAAGVGLGLGDLDVESPFKPLTGCDLSLSLMLTADAAPPVEDSELAFADAPAGRAVAGLIRRFVSLLDRLGAAAPVASSAEAPAAS